MTDALSSGITVFVILIISLIFLRVLISASVVGRVQKTRGALSADRSFLMMTRQADIEQLSLCPGMQDYTLMRVSGVILHQQKEECIQNSLCNDTSLFHPTAGVEWNMKSIWRGHSILFSCCNSPFLLKRLKAFVASMKVTWNGTCSWYFPELTNRECPVICWFHCSKNHNTGTQVKHVGLRFAVW